jgi:membrane dipeptidase
MCRDEQTAAVRNPIVVDAHQEILDEFIYQFILRESSSGRNPAAGSKTGVFDTVYLPLLKRQGVNFVNMAVGGDHVAQVMYSASDFRFWDAHKKLDALQTELESGCESFVLIRAKEDIDTAIEENNIGIFTTIAGGRPLEGKPNLSILANLRNLFRAGLRGLQLTGNGRNRLADGVGQSRTGGRLTDFGVKVVKEANRLGMVIDSSQLSDSGFFDLVEITDRPVIDSHTCAAAVWNHPRNISDERIRAVAETGGVIGVSFRAALVGSGDTAHPGVDALLRHLDHIANTGGIDHVALGPDYCAYKTPKCRDNIKGYGNLGPDFCGFDRLTPVQSEKYPGWIEGVWYGIRDNDFIDGPESMEKFSLITEALVNHGYSEEERRKILGENFLQVYRTVLPDKGNKPCVGLHNGSAYAEPKNLRRITL